MLFDFETSADRSGIGNMKGAFSQQPGTIVLAGAEMDCRTAPVIRSALAQFAERGLYGFTLPDGQYREKIVSWMEHIRGYACEPEEIVPALGTIFGLCTAIRAFTEPGDGVIIQHPSYYRYDVAVNKNGRRVISNPLIEESNAYQLDLDGLEEQMRDSRNKLMVLCNPHNPTGRVFPESDLKKLAALTEKYGTIIFSDEIFAEVTYGGHTVVPYVKVDPQHGITSTSLGKVFNLTGVNHANLLIRDADLRERYLQQRHTDHFGSIDPFFYTALTAGYSQEGWNWIQQMRDHVWENYQIIRQTLEHRMPEIAVSPLEGTYAVWMDFRKLGLSDQALQDFLTRKAHVLCDPGDEYGPGGAGFCRFNIATPRKNILEFMDNLTAACTA